MKGLKIYLALLFSLTFLMMASCTSNTSNSFSKYPPLDKRVCVVYDNTFYAIEGNLEAFLSPLLTGPNLVKTQWEEVNSVWGLSMTMQDPVSKENHKLDLVFSPTEVDSNYVCVTRVLADGEESGSAERADFIFQIAERAGLDYE